MNTCDTCKHWDGNELCDRRFKVCRRLNELFAPGESWKDIVIFAGSADDERNTIHTGPKFGCVHYEQARQREFPQT